MNACRLAVAAALAGSALAVLAGPVTPRKLRCEHLTDPLGIDTASPRLSWRLEDGRPEDLEARAIVPRGLGQSAYRVLVASSRALLENGTGDLWDSGKVQSDSTAHVVYAGKPLSSRQTCFWKVKVYDQSGQDCGWSATASWEMGLLASEDWKAKWIEAASARTTDNASLSGALWIWCPEPGADLKRAAPAGERFFRRAVTLPAGARPASASLLLTVDDQHTLFVNGKELGAFAAKDGWRTPKRYDLLPALKEGENVIALAAKNVESAAGVCAKLVLQPAAGEATVIVTDKSWKSSASAAQGWSGPGFDDASWQAAAELAPAGKGIWGDFEAASSPQPAPLLRKTFRLADKPVASARLYAAALGLYQLNLNGQRAGDVLFAPEWTDYRKRIRYTVYDVTRLLQKGDNALAALLGHGWYSGHTGNGNYRLYGKTPALFAQLEITYTDGTRDTTVTDGSWVTAASPILSSDFMLGESYDARAESGAWNKSALDGQAWKSAVVREEAAVPLEGPVTQPPRLLAELRPKAVTEPKAGRWTFDLGQNMVGYVRLAVTAPAGTTLTLRHAEVLNPDGTLYTANLRGAPSVDTYICKGGGKEVWQPHFTFHGFRYVEVTGLPDKPASDLVTGFVIGSDTPKAGEFACSDPRINQLYSNICWGQRGNYLSIPTDCPQRDERLGWMGDAQVFVRTATYNADVAAFFTKWLVDVDDAQTPDGAFTDVCPRAGSSQGTPAWGDAGVICPWTIYHVYGDARLLERHYPAMVKWIEWCRTHSNGLIRDDKKSRGGDYGDWLSIGADTPKDLIGTAYFAYSTRLVSRAAAALGKADDAAQYEQLFQEIKAAFNAKYVAPDGRIAGNTQCGYVMALKFELLPEGLRAKAAQHLAADIAAKQNHLSTGFVGVSYLLPVLTQAGLLDAAYTLFLQDTFPSWLFSVKHGATTIWERWDGWTPDKGFQDPGMNSFNHYSLGSCGEWMFSTLAGIDTDGPGFKKLLIKPAPPSGSRASITWAKAAYDSINGRIATAWRLDSGKLALAVSVPPNTTATVRVPTKSPSSVTESGKPAAQAPGVKALPAEPGAALYTVASGVYRFECAAP